MAATKHKVTIKGTKDGLVFLMDDDCSFDELISELKNKVEHSHQKFLSGPIIKVTIQLGSRYITSEQEQKIRNVLRTRGNLIIHDIVSDVMTKEEALLERLSSEIRLEVRNVRSGQVLEHDGDVLLLGDVNPGGCILATGSIYILGSLRGMAHAGKEGDDQAVIAASELRPTQLRIAKVISRPPEEWLEKTSGMECAYLNNNEMTIDKTNAFHRIRPDWPQKS